MEHRPFGRNYGSRDHFPPPTRQAASNPREAPLESAPQDHVANVSHDLAGRLRLAERAVVHKPLRQAHRSRPSGRTIGRIFVRHVDVKMPIANHLEQHDLTVVARCVVGPESSDRRFNSSRHPPSNTR